MNKEPLVTIITVTYNLINNGRKDWFIQNLESVQNQTYKNIEQIVIDGASADGTIELLEEYQQKGWIKYYSEHDKGIYDAMNKGILKANGKYVVCLNSDDFYCDNHAVEWLVSKAEETNSDACYAHANRVEPKTLKHINDFPGRGNFMPWKPQFPCHQCFLIKTDTMKELGLYNLAYKACADNAFLIRMVQNNKNFCNIDEHIINFRDGGFTNDNMDIVEKEKTDCLYNELGKFHGLTKYDCSKLIWNRFLNLPISEAIKLGSKLCDANNPEWIEQYFTILINHVQNQNKDKNKIEKNKKTELNSKIAIKYLTQKVFSVKNGYKKNKKYKVITIFGIKVKLKSKTQQTKRKNCKDN